MVYSISWDEGVPVGATTPAADIDTEIQKVKTSLRERLEDVLPDFDDDLLDPKKITIDSDVLANRPASPSYQGQLYFASDTSSLYIGDAALAWIAVATVVEEGDDETPSASFSVTAALSSTYNLPADTNWHKLSGWTVKGTRGTFYSGGSPTRFTVPSSGDYKYSAAIWMGTGGTIGKAGFGINGGTPSAFVFGREIDTGGAAVLEFVLHSQSAGDYVEFYVQNESITSPSTVVHANDWTHVTIHRLP